MTLVDCPGHASLIRTVIGGARIIDAMLLVVDATKGLQAQTTECLAVGEMAARRMVVALNKVDLLNPPEDRQKLIKKAKRRLAAALEATRFAGAPMVAVCARPGAGAGDAAAASAGGQEEAGGLIGIEELRAALVDAAEPRDPPDPSAPFLFAADHCFGLRGQGTVLTGTVMGGRVSVGDAVELPALKLTRQVGVALGWCVCGGGRVGVYVCVAAATRAHNNKHSIATTQHKQPPEKKTTKNKSKTGPLHPDVPPTREVRLPGRPRRPPPPQPRPLPPRARPRRVAGDGADAVGGRGGGGQSQVLPGEGDD